MTPAAASAAAAADSSVAVTTAMEWVLTGGEDHSLIATFPASTRLPTRWRVIGAVRPGTGVTVDDAPHAGPGGWQHFQS